MPALRDGHSAAASAPVAAFAKYPLNRRHRFAAIFPAASVARGLEPAQVAAWVIADLPSAAMALGAARLGSTRLIANREFPVNSYVFHSYQRLPSKRLRPI